MREVLSLTNIPESPSSPFAHGFNVLKCDGKKVIQKTFSSGVGCHYNSPIE